MEDPPSDEPAEENNKDTTVAEKPKEPEEANEFSASGRSTSKTFNQWCLAGLMLLGLTFSSEQSSKKTTDAADPAQTETVVSKPVDLSTLKSVDDIFKEAHIVKIESDNDKPDINSSAQGLFVYYFNSSRPEDHVLLNQLNEKAKALKTLQLMACDVIQVSKNTFLNDLAKKAKASISKDKPGLFISGLAGDQTVSMVEKPLDYYIDQLGYTKEGEIAYSLYQAVPFTKVESLTDYDYDGEFPAFAYNEKLAYPLNNIPKKVQKKYDNNAHKASYFKKPFIKYSVEYGVNPYVTAAVGLQESEHDPNAISRDNAIGNMQELKITANEYLQEKYQDPDYSVTTKGLKDPDTNIYVGTRHLTRLLRKYKGEGGLAAYNDGEGDFNRTLLGTIAILPSLSDEYRLVKPSELLTQVLKYNNELLTGNPNAINKERRNRIKWVTKDILAIAQPDKSLSNTEKISESEIPDVVNAFLDKASSEERKKLILFAARTYDSKSPWSIIKTVFSDSFPKEIRDAIVELAIQKSPEESYNYVRSVLTFFIKYEEDKIFE